MGQSTFVKHGTAGVVLAITLAVLGATQATAADVTEGFATAGTLKSGVGSGASMVLLGDLSWGGYNAGPNNLRSRNGFLEWQSATNVTGSYAFTRFGASVELDKIEVNEKAGTATVRLLVRDAGTGNKWYASEPIDFAAGTAQYSPGAYQWSEVTTGGDLLSSGTGGTWVALAFSTTPVAWPGLTIDGGGFYIETGNAANYQIESVTWKAPIVGAVTIPNLAGQTEAAAAAALTTLGLTVTTPSLQAYSDEQAAGLVTVSNPAAGIQVAPGSAVQLTVSVGPAQMWDWSPAGSSLDFGDENNWVLAGSNALHLVADFAKPIDVTERVRFFRPDVATLGAGESMTAEELLVGSGGTVVIDGGALTANGAISSIGMTSFGAGTAGTLEVRSGSATFGNLNISVNNESYAGPGTLRIFGGTVICGRLNICQANAGGGTATGALELVGPAGIIAPSNYVTMYAATSRLRFIATAAGFGAVTITSANRSFTANGAIEIDASAYDKNNGDHVWTLVSGASIFIQTNPIIVANAKAALIPAAGTSASDWDLYVSNGKDLVLTYSGTPAVSGSKFWYRYM